MKCIEVQRLVKPYIEKQLSDRELEQFLEHVEHCPECYDELEIYFSIYETLRDSGEDQGSGEYDFKRKLNQDMKNSWRYLYLRKAYRFFRFAVILLAELLLICTVITGMEMLGEEGSHGTTIYRFIYGEDVLEKESMTETDTQEESEELPEMLSQQNAAELVSETKTPGETSNAASETKAPGETSNTVSETKAPGETSNTASETKTQTGADKK